MTFKTELIALAVRVLATKTSLIHKPEPFEVFMCSLFGDYESYDQRIAREVEAEMDRAVRTVKNVRREREFKNIVAKY
jgi:hypothetical protein